MGKEFIKDKLDTAVRIRQIRENAGLTQEAFAEILGISLSGYKKIENAENQISLNGLRRLKRELHVSTDYILLGEDENLDVEWDRIMCYTDSDKMLLMLRLLLYFTKAKDSTFYLRNKQDSIDETILHVIDEFKKRKR